MILVSQAPGRVTICPVSDSVDAVNTLTLTQDLTLILRQRKVVFGIILIIIKILL